MESGPRGLSEEEMCQFLKSKGSIDVKQLIAAFRKFFYTEEDKRGFIDILKKLAHYEDKHGIKFVSLKKQYL